MVSLDEPNLTTDKNWKLDFSNCVIEATPRESLSWAIISTRLRQKISAINNTRCDGGEVKTFEKFINTNYKAISHRFFFFFSFFFPIQSVIMLMFREEKSPEDEIKAWQFWHSRQHSVKQRILDAGKLRNFTTL